MMGMDQVCLEQTNKWFKKLMPAKDEGENKKK